jgi:hypothetical protein
LDNNGDTSTTKYLYFEIRKQSGGDLLFTSPTRFYLNDLPTDANGAGINSVFDCSGFVIPNYNVIFYVKASAATTFGHGVANAKTVGDFTTSDINVAYLDVTIDDEISSTRGQYLTSKPTGATSNPYTSFQKGIVKKIGEAFKGNKITFSSPEQHGGAINKQYLEDTYGGVTSYTSTTSQTDTYTAKESGTLLITYTNNNATDGNISVVTGSVTLLDEIETVQNTKRTARIPVKKGSSYDITHTYMNVDLQVLV